MSRGSGPSIRLGSAYQGILFLPLFPGASQPPSFRSLSIVGRTHRITGVYYRRQFHF